MHFLADRSAETGRALAEKRLMQQEVIDAQNQLEETNRGTCDITRDMTRCGKACLGHTCPPLLTLLPSLLRQYKSMQEELLQRINELEVLRSTRSWHARDKVWAFLT
jgi:hypothetical protein